MRKCMRVRRLVPAFDKWYRDLAYGEELRSKWKIDTLTAFASRIEHRLGLATVPEPNSGDTPELYTSAGT